MLHSMTGYSQQTFSLTINNQKVPFAIELKTLNTRFFEITSRLATSLHFLETDLTTRLKKLLIRGRTYLTIHPTQQGGSVEAVSASMSLAEAYAKAARDVQKHCSLAGELELSDLMRLPNIFISEKTVIDEAMQRMVVEQVEDVAAALMKARRFEGEHIEADIAQRLALCTQHIGLIEELGGNALDAHKKTISSMLMKSKGGDEEARLKLDDLYATLNKLDIHEEITRFKSHLTKFQKLLSSDDVEKGKRFDFILQELMRETNTIAAKCSTFEISTLAVDVKVEIEKIREQVQNVL